MTIGYCSGLPAPLVSGYKTKDNAKIHHDNLKIGFSIFDVLTEDSYFKADVSFIMTELQFQVFEGWFKHELSFGARSFAINLKVGSGYKLTECYFDKGYKSSLLGKKWSVKAKLICIKVYDTLTDYNTAKALVGA